MAHLWLKRFKKKKKKTRKGVALFASCSPGSVECQNTEEKKHKKKMTIIEKYRRKQKFSSRHFVGKSCRCTRTLVALMGKWHPGTLRSARRCSHGNRSLSGLERSAAWEPRVVGPSNPVATQTYYMKRWGERAVLAASTHTHTQIPKIHRRSVLCCMTVTPHTWFQASILTSPSKTSPTRVKLILPGRAGGPMGGRVGARDFRDFQGMKLISIKNPWHRFLVWLENDAGSRCSDASRVSCIPRPVGIICLANEDVILIRMQAEIIERPPPPLR